MPAPAGSARRTQLTLVVGLLIGGVFTWLFLRKIDAGALRTLPARLEYRYVWLAGAVYLLEFVFRAFRWRLLIAPLKRIPLLDVLSVTFVGFMANSLLPARAGELVKPWVGARRFRLPFSSVLVTAATERVFDLLGLLSILMVMTALVWIDGSAGPSARFMAGLQWTGLGLGAVGLAGMALLFVLAARETWARQLFMRVVARLPRSIGGMASRLYDGLAAGLAAFHSPRGPMIAAAWSVAVWLNGALAIWVMSWAFDFSLPFAGACFVGLWLAIAVSVPQAPGFIGVWQIAVSETLMAWGAPRAEAAAFAIVFWLLNFVPASLLGLIATWREGLTIRAIWRRSTPLPALSAPSHAPPDSP